MTRKTFFITLLSFLLLCSLWEITARYLTEFRFLLPSLSSILSTLWSHSDLFIVNSQATIKEMAGGFSLALLMAFPLAWTMYLWKSVRTTLQPILVILQSVPMFALAPMMVFWFGWSYTAIVIPTALMIFFPLTMNIYQGLLSTPKNLLEYFQIHQATRWQTFFKLQLPWAMPHIFAGFRIAAAFAGIGAIAGEWAGAQSGLGILMLKSRRATDLDITFGSLLCLIACSMGFYALIIYAEYLYKAHRPMKRFVFLASSALIAVALWMPASQTAVFSEKQMISLLLDWFPNSNHIPIYAGIKEGIFEKHHIPLKIIELKDPSDTVPYVTSGQADLALFYTPDVIKANKKGADLKIVGVLINQPLKSFIFRSDEGISSPYDLSGKVIGYSIAGGHPKTLERMLKEKGIVPKELRNVNFDLVTLLGARQVDVIYGAYWNIEKEHLRSLGIETEHFDVSQLAHPSYSELVVISHKDHGWLPTFQKALQECIEYCKEHPEEAFDQYAKCHPDKSQKTLAWEKEAWLKTLPTLAESQQVSDEEIDRLKAWL